MSIKSRPVDLNARLKTNKKDDQKLRLNKVGRLVDNLRQMCGLPTQEQIDAQGGTYFRRPV